MWEISAKSKKKLCFVIYMLTVHIVRKKNKEVRATFSLSDICYFKNWYTVSV